MWEAGKRWLSKDPPYDVHDIQVNTEPDHGTRPSKTVMSMVDNFAETIEFHLQFMSIEKSERDSRSNSASGFPQ